MHGTASATPGAHLPGDLPTTRLGDALLDALQAPATTAIPVQRPVPRPEHTAHPASPVGRAARRATAQGHTGLLAAHGIPDPDGLPDSVLHALTERLLEVKHARIARWRALGYGGDR